MAGTDKARDRAVAVAEQQRNNPDQAGEPTVLQLLEQLRPQFARALPKTIPADKFVRIVMTTYRTGNFGNCDPNSFIAACMLSAQLGLEPGPLGHAYFVPYKREVTFIIGYKGIIDLARRSGALKSIEAREVYENDLFEYEFGLDPVLRHKPAEGDRGQLTHFYGVAHFKDGGHYFEVLTVAEIEKFRKRSAAGDRGPWKTDYVPMGRKTVIRRMAPYLPLSTEAARAIEADEGIVSGMGLDGPEVTHTNGQVIDVPDTNAAGGGEGPPPGDGQQGSLDSCPVCGAAEGEKHDEAAHVEFDKREAQA